MARTIKLTVAIVGILLFLIILAIIILPHIVDFNKHKPEVEAGIYNATGYQVSLEGDIELSFLPWLGLDVGRASVANPPDFEDENLGSVEALQIRLKVWPLLLGQVQMDRVVLKGLNLDLIKDAQGRPNWIASRPDQTIDGTRLSPSLAYAGNNEPPDQGSGDFFIPALDIAGLEITDSNISYRDLGTDAHFRIEDLNLLTERIRQDEPFGLESDMKFKSFSPELDARVDLKTQALLLGEERTVKLSDLDMDLDLSGEFLHEPIKDARIRGDIVYAFGAGSMEVSGLSVQAMDADFQGQISAHELDDIPRIRIDLEADNLDLDRLMPPPEENKESGNNRGNSPDTNPGNDENSEISLGFLHDFTLEGHIKMTSLKAYQAAIDEMTAEITSDNGEMRISPLKAKLYQGSMEGFITLRDVNDEAHIELKKNLMDVQVQPLLQDVAEKDFLSGTAELDSELKTFGTNTDMFLENLFGHARMELRDGTIRGMDLEHKIRDGFAVAFGEQRPSRDNDEKTTGFSSFKGSFDIASGIASSQDLELDSPVLGMTGDMRIDLPDSYLESRSRVTLAGALKEEIEQRYALPRAGIPLRIRGPYEDVSVSLDMEVILRDLLQEKGEGLLQQLMDQVDPEGREEQRNGARDMLQRFIPR
ncbi:AsmA family protein [Desulfonatronospira sp.]|uniref:AsmA family protein n=1 Tax=Desulfonatronospira sp. TaxID=1962951 RepID=UPI0025C1DEF6|nr:AsmA family protein [Desulfonatronospira sp.]